MYKQILTDLKGEIHSNIIRVGDFNTPLTSVDRSSWHPDRKSVREYKH